MSKQVTLTIPNELYQRAWAAAQLSNRSVLDVLAAAIVLEPPAKAEHAAPNDALKQAMDREEAAFQRLHPQLKKTLKGMYVAIYEGQLVDHDADQVALYLRVKAKYGQTFVWIAPVLAEPEEMYMIRSPRFATTEL